MNRRLSILMVCAAIVACGDGDPMLEPPDAGIDDPIDGGLGARDALAIAAPIAPAQPSEPAPPISPASPTQMSWLPCAPGWIVDTSTRTFGESICLPYLMELDCQDTFAQLPGEAFCHPIGDTCPPGDFSDQLPANSTITYVNAGELLGPALLSAKPGTIIAAAKGTFNETNLIVPEGVTLWGACAQMTSIEPSITVAGTLRNIRVAGPILSLGTAAHLDGVVASHLLVSTSALTGANVKITGDLITEPAGRVMFDRATITGTIAIHASSLVVLADAKLKDADVAGTLTLTRCAARSLSIHGKTASLTATDVVATGRLDLSEGSQTTATHLAIDGAEGVGISLSDEATHAELADVLVRNTRVHADSGTEGRGIVVVDGADLILLRAVAANNLDFAIVANARGSSLTIQDLVVRDTRANAVDLLRGIAVSAHNSATLHVARAWLEKNSAGVAIGGTGADVTLEDVAILDNVGLPGGMLGYGAAILGGMSVLHRVSIADSRFHGLLVAGGSTTVRGNDVTISAIEPQASDRLYGRGLGVESGALVELARVAIDQTHETGVSAIDPDTLLMLTDVTIFRTSPRETDSQVGYAALAQAGGSISLERATIAEATKVAIVAHPNSPLSLTDCTVRDTRSDANGEYGIGVVAVSTTVALSRVLLERNRHTAIRIEGDTAALTGNDLSIRETIGQSLDDTLGAGLLILDGAYATLSRVSVDRSRVYGIGVYREGSVLDASDVVVTNTGVDTDGVYANGLFVQDFARATITRMRLHNNAQLGVLAQVAATVILNDAEITGTRKACPSGQEGCQAGGIGVGSYASASVTLNNFLIANNEIVGAAVARGGTLDFHFGDVSGHPIGVNVETDPFDVSRLNDGVLFIDNERNFDAARLPLPNVLAEIPSPLQ